MVLDVFLSHRDVGRTLGSFGPEGAPLDLLGRLLDGPPHRRFFLAPPKALRSVPPHRAPIKKRFRLADAVFLSLGQVGLSHTIVAST